MTSGQVTSSSPAQSPGFSAKSPLGVASGCTSWIMRGWRAPPGPADSGWTGDQIKLITRSSYDTNVAGARKVYLLKVLFSAPDQRVPGGQVAGHQLVRHHAPEVEFFSFDVDIKIIFQWTILILMHTVATVKQSLVECMMDNTGWFKNNGGRVPRWETIYLK